MSGRIGFLTTHDEEGGNTPEMRMKQWAPACLRLTYAHARAGAILRCIEMTGFVCLSFFFSFLFSVLRYFPDLLLGVSCCCG